MTEDDTSTAPNESWLAYKPDGSAREVFALTIVWSLAEPHRVGEVVLLPKDGVRRLLGRGGSKPGEDIERATFFRQRPGKLEPQDTLHGQGISRRQLLLVARGDELIVERIGRCSMMFNGVAMDKAVAKPGDTIMLRNEVILLCGQRPLMMMDLEHEEGEGAARYTPGTVPFGGADDHGIVGESPEAWELRGQLPFIARRAGHVLVQGPSGAGKELVSRALHQLSKRGARPIVARNAATFPSGLIDAELFGNIKDYPNAGMRERRGLIGEADGSTLFLDEIGELPAEMQAHLLRVLDSEGSYQRLGEDRPQRADIRLVAATNRDPEQLRPDFLARLTLRITIPGLNERREDIPILARHLLRKAASQDPDLGRRLFKGGDSVSGEPRIDPHLMNLLVRHNYSQHVRELESFLWRSMTGSRGRHLALTDELSVDLAPAPVHEKAPSVLTAEVIQASLDRHEGNRTKVFKELGLKNRHVLYRLIKRYGLDSGDDDRESAPPKSELPNTNR